MHALVVSVFPQGARHVHQAQTRHLVSSPATHSRIVHRHDMNQYIARESARLVVKAASSSEFSDAAIVPILTADGTQISADITLEPGVYAVYDSSNVLQYVGISRKIAVSMATYAESLGPDMVCSAKVVEMPGAGKEELTEAWKSWIERAVEET